MSDAAASVWRSGGARKDERGELIWEPPASQRARVLDFMDWLARTRSVEVQSYEALHDWSITDLEGFWSAVTEWAGMRWSARPMRMLERGPTIAEARWFPGGRLNYAAQALAPARRLETEVAVIERSETRPRRTLTWVELVERVGRCRAGLRRLGVGPGDRVAAYLPNVEEAVVAFLATASLGAVWISCASELGPGAVLDRLAQVAPSVLIAADGYRYGGKDFDCRSQVEDVRAGLPSLEHVVGVPLRGRGDDGWGRLLSEAAHLEIEDVDARHPLFVLFSSGTTGLPKPLVHGHGGIVAEHLKVLSLHQDLGVGDRFAWITTTSWMMWNYLVSGLLVGTTIVLFDGNPTQDGNAIWRVAAEEAVTVLGLSAALIMASRRQGVRPGEPHDLGCLRILGSTGSPLPAEGYGWVCDAIGQRVQLMSASGGTDVCTGFVGMIPILPVRAGEMSCRFLGCDVRAARDDGTECDADEYGELLVDEPMPSMPLGLWGDTTDERLMQAYFERFPGRWHHGDQIAFHADGFCHISGRSDSTLNRGGVRMGTGEFYAALDSMPEVADSLVVHLDPSAHDPLGTLLLFVELGPGPALDHELSERIRSLLRSRLSPRHLPDQIVAVPHVPRTLTGKRLELPVKRILTGASVSDVVSPGSLAIPSSLEFFRSFATKGTSPSLE